MVEAIMRIVLFVWIGAVLFGVSYVLVAITMRIHDFFNDVERIADNTRYLYYAQERCANSLERPYQQQQEERKK